jgi:hypothetical protein
MNIHDVVEPRDISNIGKNIIFLEAVQIEQTNCMKLPRGKWYVPHAQHPYVAS